jgi:hypothetical protein
MRAITQIGRGRARRPPRATFWADATRRFCTHSRPGRVVAHACGCRYAVVGLAGRGAASHRAALPRAAHPLLGRPSRHRHFGAGPAGAGTRRRHRALRRHSGRPRRLVDRTRRRAAVELRAGRDAAEGRRRGAPRRRRRHAAAGALFEPVPALRCQARRRVRVAVARARRGAAVGTATHPTYSGAAAGSSVRRGGGPSRSSL